MENRTQFDLNTALQRWRENLSHSPQFRAENVQELESHLRDSIAALQTKGLSDEESFLIATRRLGAAPTLEPEFAKVNGKEVWLDRLLWMVVGVQFLALLTAISSVLARWLVLAGLMGFGYDLKYNPAQPYRSGLVPGVLLTVAQIMAFMLVLWGCRLLVRRKSGGLSFLATRFLHRPFFIGLVVVAGSMLATRFVAGFDTLLLVKWLSQDHFTTLQVSRSWAHVLLDPTSALALAALTVFLARRRLRLRANQQVPG